MQNDTPTSPSVEQAARELVAEMRAAYAELCEKALSPHLSAEQCAYLGAPGRVVKAWADRLEAALSLRPSPQPERETGLRSVLEREVAPIEKERFCGQHFQQDLHSSQSSCALCGLRETVHLKLEFLAVLPDAQPESSPPPPARFSDEDEDGNSTWHPSHRLGVLGCLDCQCGGGHPDHRKPCPMRTSRLSPSPDLSAALRELERVFRGR